MDNPRAAGRRRAADRPATDGPWPTSRSGLGPSARGERLVRGHDFAAQREQRDRNQLEVRDAERNADDGQAEQQSGDDVPDGQPPAGEHQPEHVADAGGRARVTALDRRVAEGPEGVDTDPESGDAERDRLRGFSITLQGRCGSA